MKTNPYVNSINRKRILHVKEDNYSSPNTLLRSILKIHGYEIIRTSNYRTAIKLYNDSFEIVLLEISNSNTRYIEFIQAIQRINPEVKCIALIDYSDENLPLDTLVLVRPFTFTELVESISTTMTYSEIQLTREINHLSFDEEILSKLHIQNYNYRKRGKVA